MKIISTILTVLLLSLSGFVSLLQAQGNSSADVKKIGEMLQNEFSKADLAPVDVKLGGENCDRGFCFQLLPDERGDKYGLRGKPAGSFYLKASTTSVYIASLTTEGLRNGAYWYLGFLGYRYYFPGESWHFVPELKTVYKSVEKLGVPSYSSRRIWYAYGTDSKKADADYQFWTQANLLGGEEINAGHAYEGIVNRNKKIFQQHPEYFAQKVAKGSIPKNPKFEVGNPALVELCIQDALGQIASYQKRYGKLPASISMDPSDGGGFSTSRSSMAIGGPSEQVFYLANKVAKAVREKYSSVLVGLYAYNYHSAPPSFTLEPNIVVLIATAYSQTSLTTDQLIDQWKKKGIKVGIRDYFGVLAWDWDMPGQTKGSKTNYVKQVKEFHSKGALFFSAETNIGWISRGLGHYIGARLLWDVDSDIAKIKSDFFQQMFGKAAKTMETLYSDWEQYRQAVPLDGNLVEWYRLIERAESLEQASDVRNRLQQFKEYLYYIYLFKKWKANSSDDNLVSLLNFAYRVKDQGIVSSYPLFRTLANSAVAGKQNMRYNDPNAKWKQNKTPVTHQEIKTKLGQAIAHLDSRQKAVNTQWPKKFTSSKLRTTTSPLETTKQIKLRGVHRVIFSLENPKQATINLAVGYIKANSFKPLVLRIYEYTGDLSSVKDQVLIMEQTIEPRQPLKSLSLAGLRPGTYVAVVDDARGGFLLSFTGKINYGIVADNQSMIWTLNRTNLVFDVPKGTKEIIVHTDGVLTLESPAGRKIDLQKKHPLVTVVEIKKGEEGLWKMKQQSGRLWIQGVTPLVNPEEKFLMTPEE